LHERESLLIANLSLIDRLIGSACRHQNLKPEEIEDFSSWVKLKLVEDDYAILAKFEGRCALSTYLAIVIQRFLSDYRNHLWGKWRPSARSERLGPLAVRIETLVRRDGKSPDEAFHLLHTAGESIERSEFDAIVAELPERRQRLRAVDAVDVEEELAVPPSHVEANAERGDRTAAAATITSTLSDAIAGLGTDDRTILRLHFDAGLTIAEIARSMHLEQKPLYRRLRKICDGLREQLLKAGISPSRVDELIGQPDILLDFGLRDGGNSANRPSSNHEAGEDGKDQVSR
jgi:RNA polymerase sigma factor (sigma-70 family)